MLDRIVRPALAAAGIDPAVAHVEPVVRGGLAAWHFTVDDSPGFATFAELVAAVRASTLDPVIAAAVAAVAEHMAAAERVVHGGHDDHLHELAGLDTAVDLISVTALVAALAPARVASSPPALGARHRAHRPRRAARAGAGRARAAARPADGRRRRGRALGRAHHAHRRRPAAHLADEFGGLPAGRLGASGLGAGRREIEGRPNVLRAVLVEPLDRSPGGAGPWAEEEVELLEATIDDLPAELLAAAAGCLLEAGALDVWSTPATMKKSRPGTVLHVLARPAQRAALAAVVFRETSTFGLRMLPARRLLLDERVLAIEPAELAAGDYVAAPGSPPPAGSAGGAATVRVTWLSRRCGLRSADCGVRIEN